MRLIAQLVRFFSQAEASAEQRVTVGASEVMGWARVMSRSVHSGQNRYDDGKIVVLAIRDEYMVYVYVSDRLHLVFRCYTAPGDVPKTFRHGKWVDHLRAVATEREAEEAAIRDAEFLPIDDSDTFDDVE